MKTHSLTLKQAKLTHILKVKNFHNVSDYFALVLANQALISLFIRWVNDLISLPLSAHYSQLAHDTCKTSFGKVHLIRMH